MRLDPPKGGAAGGGWGQYSRVVNRVGMPGNSISAGVHCDVDVVVGVEI